jgi:DNA segregation ATPase FtsK/SpoIIIE-like protein
MASAEANLGATDPLYAPATRTIVEAGRPSIPLLMRTYSLGYTRSANLIRAMEGDVIAFGELDRYTAHLQSEPRETFRLNLIQVGPAAT